MATPTRSFSTRPLRSLAFALLCGVSLTVACPTSSFAVEDYISSPREYVDDKLPKRGIPLPPPQHKALVTFFQTRALDIKKLTEELSGIVQAAQQKVQTEKDGLQERIEDERIPDLFERWRKDVFKEHGERIPEVVEDVLKSPSVVTFEPGFEPDKLADKVVADHGQELLHPGGFDGSALGRLLKQKAKDSPMGTALFVTAVKKAEYAVNHKDLFLTLKHFARFKEKSCEKTPEGDAYSKATAKVRFHTFAHTTAWGLHSRFEEGTGEWTKFKNDILWTNRIDNPALAARFQGDTHVDGESNWRSQVKAKITELVPSGKLGELFKAYAEEYLQKDLEGLTARLCNAWDLPTKWQEQEGEGSYEEGQETYVFLRKRYGTEVMKEYGKMYQEVEEEVLKREGYEQLAKTLGRVVQEADEGKTLPPELTSESEALLRLWGADQGPPPIGWVLEAEVRRIRSQGEEKLEKIKEELAAIVRDGDALELVAPLNNVAEALVVLYDSRFDTSARPLRDKKYTFTGPLVLLEEGRLLADAQKRAYGFEAVLAKLYAMADEIVNLEPTVAPPPPPAPPKPVGPTPSAGGTSVGPYGEQGY